MKRRKFIQQTAIVSAASPFAIPGGVRSERGDPHDFKLKYAPHIDMFEHHAGANPVDQLNFMADVGFKAFEDNSMKSRDISMQEAMATTMEKRGLEMGVFVGHEIGWREPNLANGDASLRDKFLKEIRESVEVAKRVNAKWMTIVPGHVDLRQKLGFQTAHVMESLRRACDILEPHVW